jgi:tetratricopeptide (TPR) repeat protein
MSPRLLRYLPLNCEAILTLTALLHFWSSNGLRSLTAQTYNEQALKIRRTLLPHGHSEIANALSNYAHSIICAGGNMSTALGYLHEALEINMLNPKEDRDKVLHLRHYNICYAFKAMGYFAKARQEVDTATRYVEAEFGKESRYLNM